MRFLSPHPGYSVQISPPEEKVENDPVSGQSYTRVSRQPLSAEFEAGAGLFPHEVEMALAKFEGSFKGLPENVNPVTRIAVWDSEAQAIFNQWTPEYHQHVVDKMVMLAEGPSSSRMMAVPENWRPAPWPAYDEMEEQEILAYVDVLKLDAENVRLYEGENQARPLLMESLKQIAEGTTDTPPAPLGVVTPEDVVAVV